MKTAREAALPSVVSSLVAARPATSEWFQRVEEAGIMSAATLEAVYDARLEMAREALHAKATGQHVADQIDALIL